MFENIISAIKGLINKMFSKDTIKTALGFEPCISSTMFEKIQLWGDLYSGNASWINAEKNIYSIKCEQGICRELANISLNEMTVTISDSTLEKLFKATTRGLNENLQKGLALGSFVIKPLGQGKAEYVTADRFIPIEYDVRGRLKHVAFIETRVINKNSYYRRFEVHNLTDKGLIIYNKAYHSTTELDIGRPCPLNSIEDWAGLPETPLLYAIDRPDFGYYRNPLPNAIDGSYGGVSIYDSVIDLIKQADLQFANLNWEFESGQRAIMVDDTAIKNNTVETFNKRLYKGLDSKGLYEEFSPAFRDESLINGLNAILRRIEFNVGLAYGDLSDVADVAKTATEIRTAKQRKYNTVTAIQDNLKDCLEDFLFALAFHNGKSDSFEFVCDFKDSVLTDEDTERKQDLTDVSIGALPLWKYIMKWQSLSEEEAKAQAAETNVNTIME